MTDALRLAKHYFDHSNDGKLAEIDELFTPSSTYSSVHTGVHPGAERIMDRQSGFFAGFETMRRNVHGVEEVKPGIVLFDFTFNGATVDGEDVCRPGLEYVVVHEGKLQHVEVRNRD